MERLFISSIIGVVLGILAGLFIGWEVAPLEYVNSPISALAPRYREEYTLMIAAAYLEEADPAGAVERLRVLGIDNVPAFVQDMTERFISNSRELEDIRYLVALSEGLGRLTPIMEPYRQLSVSRRGS